MRNAVPWMRCARILNKTELIKAKRPGKGLFYADYFRNCEVIKPLSGTGGTVRGGLFSTRIGMMKDLTKL